MTWLLYFSSIRSHYKIRWWRMIAKKQLRSDTKGSTDCEKMSLFWKVKLFHTEYQAWLDFQWPTINQTGQKRSQMEFKNEKFSDKSCINTDKDKTVGSLLTALAHTIPQQGCDWCSCCSWTFTVSVWKAIKHKHSLMSSASGSLLPEEPLSVAVYNVMPKVNCVLTTLSHRKDRIALQN